MKVKNKAGDEVWFSINLFTISACDEVEVLLTCMKQNLDAHAFLSHVAWTWNESAYGYAYLRDYYYSFAISRL